jgi:hypothetical protein
MRKTKRHKYYVPKIKLIRIDNDISLQLESDVPPAGPNEIVQNNSGTYFIRRSPFET